MSLLYKYRHFENPYHLRVLTDGELRFTPPVEFNDPHDCRIPLRWDKANQEWLESELEDRALEEMPEQECSVRDASVVKALEQMSDSERQTALLEYQMRKIVSPKVGVLSFSLEPAHPLMWAHYADSHEGFVVGFDQEKLLAEIRNISGAPRNAEKAAATPGMEIRPVDVDYVEEMPVLVPGAKSDSEVIEKIVTTKRCEWEYESEIRYLMNKYNDEMQLERLSDRERIVSFPTDAISEVTLGVNVSYSDASEVAEILSDGRPRVRLFRASPSFGQYGLDRREIAY